MHLLIINIKGLVQVRETGIDRVEGKAMSELPVLTDAFLSIRDGIIEDFGPMDMLTSNDADRLLDARGRFVLPGFVDSHTHLVFPASREGEFVDKINGLSYVSSSRMWDARPTWTPQSRMHLR